MNIWTKLLIALAILAAVIAVAVALAPYIVTGLGLWLAWKLVVGPALDRPESLSGSVTEVDPTVPPR